jgi:hypothetical protein
MPFVSHGHPPPTFPPPENAPDLEGLSDKEKRAALKDYKTSLRDRTPVELADLRGMTPRQRREAIHKYKMSTRRD